MSDEENVKNSKIGKPKSNLMGKPGSKRNSILRILTLQGGKKSSQLANKPSKGKTKRTKRLQAAYDKAKNYRDCLNEVAMALSDVIQHHVEYTRNKNELVFEAPELLDDYELIFKTLEKNRQPGKSLSSFPNMEQYSQAMHGIIAFHRGYHQESAATLKLVSDFLYKEFREIEAQYGEINSLREELEQATAETGTGTKRVDEIAKEIDRGSKELEKMLKKTMTADNVLRHATAIVEWRERQKTYHGKTLEELGKLMKRCNLSGDTAKLSGKEMEESSKDDDKD